MSSLWARHPAWPWSRLGASVLCHLKLRAGVWVLAGIATGCQLVFGDFEIDDSLNPEATGGSSQAGGSPGMAGAASACEEGTTRCDGSLRLVVCQNGTWQEKLSCTPPAFCDDTLPGCAACRAGDFQCRGSELQTCNEARDGWRTVEVCEPAETCDPQERSCVLCARGETVCRDSVTLASCSATRKSWEERTCIYGCVDVAERDYCAECEVPGEAQCSNVNTLRTCSNQREWIVEVCPGECVDNGSADFCAE